MRLQWSKPRTPHQLRRPTSYQMVKSLPLVMLDSDAQSICSSPLRWTERNSTQSKTWPTTPSRSAMSMWEEIFIRTSSYQEVPPCSKALVRDYLKKLNQEHLSLFRLKLLPAQTEDSPFGEEDLLLLHSLPLLVCGSLRRTMMSMELLLCTENAFEWTQVSS